jgi:cysteine synthase A
LHVCAAASLLASRRLPAGAVAVTVLCDTGLKY